MTRHVWRLGIAVLFGALMLNLTGCTPAPAAEVPVPVVPVPVVPPNRWQIVNGMPGIAATIMLLDTQTGDSWIHCNSDTDGKGWCRMFRSGETTKGSVVK